MGTNNICPLCREELIPLWKNHRFSFCKRCGLKVRSTTRPQEIDALYNQSWDDPNINISETGGTNQFLAKTYLDMLSRQLGNYEYSGKRILDFGAGRGDIVEALVERGATPTCLEPYGYELLSKKGFSVIKELNELDPNMKFQGVICIDVIEHLQNPLEGISSIIDYIDRGGWLFISTPNSSSIKAQLQGNRWVEANRAGHLFLFTPDSMKSILVKAGFSKVVRLHWNVRYHDHLARRIVNTVLTMVRTDGELRYLAFK